MEAHFDLDLARLDHRVEAHIDGLRIAGDEGWQLCRKELDWKEPGGSFCGGGASFQRSYGRIAEVLKVGDIRRSYRAAWRLRWDGSSTRRLNRIHDSCVSDLSGNAAYRHRGGSDSSKGSRRPMQEALR